MDNYNSVTIREVWYLVIIQWWSAKVKYIDVSKVVWKKSSIEVFALLFVDLNLLRIAGIY